MEAVILCHECNKKPYEEIHWAGLVWCFVCIFTYLQARMREREPKEYRICDNCQHPQVMDHERCRYCGVVFAERVIPVLESVPEGMK